MWPPSSVKWYWSWTVLFAVVVVAAGQYWEPSVKSKPPLLRQTKDDHVVPDFEEVTKNVSAAVGQAAYLPCQVKHLGDKTVSWIRQRDLHILTSGLHVYTSDARFEVLHPSRSTAWTLRLTSVQKRDQGVYECQVNTDPKMMLAINLRVTGENEARIIGPEKQEAKPGSSVNFTCLVRHKSSSDTLSWYHGSTRITVRSRKGVSLETHKTTNHSTSRLIVAHIEPADAGSYTCVPEFGASATVTLVVRQGEHSQAMQGDEKASSEPSGSSTTQSHLGEMWPLFCLMATLALT